MSNIEIKFRFAKREDVEKIAELLKKCNLPSEDFSGHLKDFMVAVVEREIIATAGLQIPKSGEAGLLRSVAVAKQYRKRGIATKLYKKIYAHARLRGVKEFFLLTDTAGAVNFFASLGFSKIGREDAAVNIRATEQFKTHCPLAAVCMTKDINRGGEYFPREALRLQNDKDAPGAAMWAVALQETMMTCFTLEPDCRFEMHSHVSEQITMVLEGELFFETANGVVCVGVGCVIALPSNLPHAVYTKKKGAKAVDAWSPVMEKYVS